MKFRKIWQIGNKPFTLVKLFFRKTYLDSFAADKTSYLSFRRVKKWYPAVFVCNVEILEDFTKEIKKKHK